MSWKDILSGLWTKIRSIPQRWIEYGILITVIYVLGFFGVKLDPPTPPDIPIWQQTNEFGWKPDPDAVDRVVGQLQFKTFADTPAYQAGDDLPKEVCLWKFHLKVAGELPRPQNQRQVGSCVSFGTARAIERSLASEIANGAAFDLRYLCEEVIYGGSRVEIGGGQIRGDGSNGSWAAKFAHDYGIIDRGVYGSYDLTTYSESRCREWGSRGVPNDLEPEVKKYPVKEIAMVTTWDQAKRSLANGYGIAICSGQGFTMQRDSRGICRASGSWAHCMCLDGYHIEPDGTEYGHIENSWGPTAHTGPVGWGEPNTAGFWASSKTIDSMLRQRDSWAFSNVRGFPPKKLDWWIRGNPVRNPNDAFANRQLLNPIFAFAR
jgi:hypothetical protein